MAVSPTDLYNALRASGDAPLVAAAAVAIAGRESGYDPLATSGYRPATGDFFSTGLFQINLGSKWGPGGPYGGTQDIHGSQLVKAGLSAPYNDLRTVAGSITGFNTLYNADGLSPWRSNTGGWSTGTNLAAAASASGGEVSLSALQTYAQTNGGGGGGGTSETTAGTGSTSTSATDLAATSADSDCVWKLTMPSSIPNICVTHSQGRALLGAVSMLAGFGVLALGLSFAAKGAIVRSVIPGIR